jgi:hypothetical protein
MGWICCKVTGLAREGSTARPVPGAKSLVFKGLLRGEAKHAAQLLRALARDGAGFARSLQRARREATK